MNYLSKFMVKINNQLIITIIVVIILTLGMFGIVLPMSIKYLVNHKMYHILLEEQQAFIQEEEAYREGPITDVYHYTFLDNEPLYEEEQLDPEILHHLMMYPEFFKGIKGEATKAEQVVSFHMYKTPNEHIYYLINKIRPGEMLVSYKVDNTSEVLAHELLMNTLSIAVFIFILILIVFLKWTSRLINNLKDIQGVLDTIEGDNLRNAIPTNNYTEEFQEVMCSLDRMRKRLCEEEEAKQQMLHNISHDLKTPLAVIKNYAEGIIDGVYPYGTVEETAHIIYNHAERLEKKVQGLLYLNRLEYLRGIHEAPQWFEMGLLVQEVVSYMKDYEGRQTIEVDTDQSEFKGDPEKWRIVLENLIDNAKRYAKHKICIRVEQDSLSIYNDGEPISIELQTKIFQPFEKGVDGVTGLGLAIVKKTIELYNYEITMCNEEKGVTFTIF